MDPVILASARKHGVPDEDIIHAYQHPIRVLLLDDLTMLIGSDLAGLRALRALGVPLLADESARDEDDVARLIDAEAVDGLVLKPMVIGGLQRSLTLAERAAAPGLSVVVTTALDAAIGRAGALHVAAACPQAAVWPCGLDTGGLLERDLFVSDRVIGGTISPRGPGLGLVPLATACPAPRLAGSPGQSDGRCMMYSLLKVSKVRALVIARTTASSPWISTSVAILRTCRR